MSLRVPLFFFNSERMFFPQTVSESTLRCYLLLFWTLPWSVRRDGCTSKAVTICFISVRIPCWSRYGFWRMSSECASLGHIILCKSKWHHVRKPPPHPSPPPFALELLAAWRPSRWDPCCSKDPSLGPFQAEHPVCFGMSLSGRIKTCRDV